MQNINLFHAKVDCKLTINFSLEFRPYSGRITFCFPHWFIYVRREKRKCTSRVACICGRSARKEGRQSILIPIIASLSDCNWVGLEPPTASIHGVSFVMPEDWNNEGTEVSPLRSYESTGSIFWLCHTCSFRVDELSRNELLKIIYCLCINWIFLPSNFVNFVFCPLHI